MSNLNYLPIEVKNRRLNKALIKIGLSALVITITSYALPLVQVASLKSDLEDKQSQVAVAKSLEASIQTENQKLQESLSIVYSIGSNPLPLNQFLGTILTKTPKDIFINDIFTSPTVVSVTKGATQTSPVPNPVPPTDANGETVPTDPSATPTTPVTTETPATTPTTDPVQAGATPTEGETSTEGETAQSTTPPPLPEGASIEAQAKSITIRGSAFSLTSISYLAGVLKNEPYVQSVELSPIENYDDSHFNHKIFEIVLVLREGV